ncbi:MAG: VOC family protein [Actinobacteria bacterium]|nr:VOC family protein [Actinomycetota bacterium]
MYARIDNVDLLCRDVGVIADFYHGVLGLPFHFPFEREEGWVALDAGNLTIFIFETTHEADLPRRTPVNEVNRPGWDSLAFEVEDLDAEIARLDGQVEWAAEIIEWKHPSGAWYRYRPIYDPEGNMFYVTEPHR